jgi:hypothetical protein
MNHPSMAIYLVVIGLATTILCLGAHMRGSMVQSCVKYSLMHDLTHAYINRALVYILHNGPFL